MKRKLTKRKKIVIAISIATIIGIVIQLKQAPADSDYFQVAKNNRLKNLSYLSYYSIHKMVERLTITVRDWLFELIEMARKNGKKQSRSEFVETILSKYFMRAGK